MGRSWLWQSIFCGQAFLVLFLVCPDLVASQPVVTDFALRTLNSSTMNCTGRSTLTPNLEGVKQAACLTPFPCTSGSDEALQAISGQCNFLSPIQFSQQRSFSTMFSFNTLKFPTYNPGEGFTFFLSPEEPHDNFGAAGGFLGWLSPSTDGNSSGHNFAVEFDLVQETTGGFNDPPKDHVGVNVNNLNSTYLAEFDPQYLTTLSSTATLYAWVEYDGERKWIDVRLSQTKEKPCKPIISDSLDLSTVLVDVMYAGFSSSTGGTGVQNNTQYNTQTTVWDWSFSTYAKAANIYGSNEKCGLSVSKTMILGIVVGVLSFVVIVMLVVILLLHLRTRKVSDLEKEKAELVAELKQLDFGARQFTFLEIMDATRGLSEKIGEGGFGTVYKGSLSNLPSHKGADTIIAVKEIKRTTDSADDAKQLVSEVKVIGRLRHVNIVPVLGWCYERGQMLLVYKYMENGDLDRQIFPHDYGIKGGETFPWEKRMSVLRGVASALKFLHEDFESEKTVLHRDIKTTNVLIDRNFNARLGDFGLARFYDGSTDGYQSQQLVGTRGYMAPEYLAIGASVETDVYSFGVLALVAATGRKPVDRIRPLPGGLVHWVGQLYSEGNITDAGDPKVVKNDPSFNLQELEKVLKVGLLCCVYEPLRRPLMRDVVSALQVACPILSGSFPECQIHDSSKDVDVYAADDYDDKTQPFDDFHKDDYYTAQLSLSSKVDIP